MNICITFASVNWELIKDIFSITASIATLIGSIAACAAAYFAYRSISTWQKSILLQKKYEYIQYINSALDTMQRELHSFRYLLSRNKVDIDSFEVDKIGFIQAQVDFIRYTSLLKEELTEVEIQTLELKIKVLFDCINVYIASKPISIHAFDTENINEELNNRHNGVNVDQSIKSLKKHLRHLKQDK
jgi:hypothetical protein